MKLGLAHNPGGNPGSFTCSIIGSAIRNLCFAVCFNALLIPKNERKRFMKFSVCKLTSVFSSLAIILLVSSNPEVATAQKRSPLTGRQQLRVLTLQGSPYNRGLLHGKTLRKEIHEIIKFWKAEIESNYKVKADKFIADFLQQTDFQPAIKRWTPELLDEVRGIADGAGIDFNTIFMYQLADEEWAQWEDIAAGEHCSSIGVNRTGASPSFVAQNMDIPTYYQGYQTLLRIKDEGGNLESLVLTVPGAIGVNGLNSHAVAITCNTLLKLEYSKDGLPVSFIVRGVLRQKTLKDAVDFLHNIKHASGQNYIIGGPERTYSLECSANKVAEFIAYKGAQLTYHTNHPLANDDYNHRYLANLQKQNKTPKEDPFYCYRLEALEKRLKNRAQVDVDLIKASLSSRDYEKNPVSNKYTYACTIMVLSARPELHIAPGPPHETAFKIIRFSDNSINKAAAGSVK
jgi:isopenicillin-N N-acyltransferase like protein